MDKGFEDKIKKVEQLNAVLAHLKTRFVGKDDIIDLMGICLAGRENLFMLGPPGTAKSAMVKELSKLLKGKTFEYLLTRFTEPNELFGPFDIRKLREGELVTNTEGMLPEANLIFLDELLNANSAILNSLLMVLNEKVFRRGRETKSLPVLMIVGASNRLPEDESLQALFDRFLVRVKCDYVDPALLGNVLDAGWNLERSETDLPSISFEEILDIQSLTALIDLTGITAAYIELIQKLRNAGMQVSDRRAVKLQRLIAASAVISKRQKALLSDLWVVRYIWDTEEQVEVITSIVNSVIDSDNNRKDAHLRAFVNTLPDSEEIYNEVNNLSVKWGDQATTLSDRAVIKDRLRYLNGRSEWIQNEVQRNYVQVPIRNLWDRILSEV